MMNCNRYFISGYLKNFPRLLSKNFNKILIRNCYKKGESVTCLSEDEKKQLHLSYKIVMVRKSLGRISWRNCTGNFVTVGESICDIIEEDLSITTIYAPVSGIIANRFVNEGIHISGETLICLIKVCESKKQKIDVEGFIKKKQLYYQLRDFDVDVDLIDDLEKSPVKRIQAKDFIAPRADIFLDDVADDELDRLNKKQTLDKLSDILDQRRREQFEKYIPEHMKDEMKHSLIEDAMTSLPSIQSVSTDKISGEIFQNLVQENFSSIVKFNLNVLNNGVINKYLTASVEIDLTNAIQYAVDEGSRNNLKFVIKFIFLTAAVNTFKELPYLISTKDRSINITVGCISGDKLGFPLIRNIDKMSHTDIKEKLISIENALIQGKHLEDIDIKHSELECLAITNEWDFGNISAPSCLYLSNYATLALNTIVVKPTISQNYEISFAPLMSIYLTFFNGKIHGQDAYLFLNKLKHCVEELHHLSNS